MQPHCPLIDRQAPWRVSRSAELLSILDDFVEFEMRQSPIEASTLGDERFNDRLPDLSPGAVEAAQSQTRELRSRLRALDTSLLSESDRTDASLLDHVLSRRIEGERFHPEHLPVDARSGPQVWLAQLHTRVPLRTPKHFADLATRLERVAEHVDQTIEQMRLGVAAGRVQPRAAMIGVLEQARLLASPDFESTPAISPFYAAFQGQDQSSDAAIRAKKAITSLIVPAYSRLATFVESEYLPACRETFGASQSVDGMAWYDFALRLHTTTDLNAEQVHAIGLSEVTRIRAEMLRVIAKTDFARPDGATDAQLLAAFLDDLRSNPRFYFRTADELLARYRDIAKRVDYEMPRLFKVLPRLPYGVREIPAIAAPTSPTAYYYSGSLESGVAGAFMANTFRLDQRPKYEMIPLTMHEAVPGHHLQIALAQEIDGQHPFRSLIGFTAFVEGWGLYAERLGLEVGGEGATPNSPGGTGLYADPYDDFGRLTYEMWRACRLVVDTGLHAKRWNRAAAIDFMLANTALSQHNIEREVDRYIAWPGQACAYKLGELKLRELRARAERELGAAFDVREFHHAVLGAGAVPLPTLEANIERWVSACKASDR